MVIYLSKQHMIIAQECIKKLKRKLSTQKDCLDLADSVALWVLSGGKGWFLQCFLSVGLKKAFQRVVVTVCRWEGWKREKRKIFPRSPESKWCGWRENQSVQRSGPVLCSSAVLPPLLPTVPVSQGNKHLHYSFRVGCGKCSEKPLLWISAFIICF